MHAFIAAASCWVASATGFVSLEHRMNIRSMNSSLNSNSDLISAHFTRMSVVELKKELRRVNLPVSGRKQELLHRLNEYHSNGAILQKNVSYDIHDDVETYSDDDLRSLTVPVLKEKLKAIGLPVAGRKQELIKRLRGHANLTDEVPGHCATDQEDLCENDDNRTIDENASVASEDETSRRARRKKYFKTQEVRELIRANDPCAPLKGEEMIATLELMAKEENDDEYLPGAKQYTTLIDAYANSDTRSATAVIERIMKSNLQLTTIMMNAIMGVYVNMGTVEGAKEATTILERMEYTRDFGGSAVRPTVYSYSLAISAWAKCSSFDAATSAEAILARLLKSYEKVSLINNESDYAEELKPNSVVFNSVIDAWANSGSSICGEKAEEILNKMEVYSRMENHYDIRPDTITFNTCIKAWCNSKTADAPQKAEELLLKLETHPEYPKRGGVLIVRPNLRSYNTVINAWAKSSSLESASRSEAILTRMLKRYKAETYSTIKPDVVTFSSVLNALAKSKVHYKAEKCLAILESMIDLHEEDGSIDSAPNVICFNTVLNGCAFSAMNGDDEKKRALSVAVKTFKMLKEQSFARPDALSYGNMLKCCANLMPIGDARTAMASTIFSACCIEGFVGGMVLDEIRRCIPSNEFVKLLAKCGYEKPLKQRSNAMSINLGQLPRKWISNVKRGDMFTRQRGIAVKPKRTERVKNIPVIRNPSFLIESSWASGKDV